MANASIRSSAGTRLGAPDTASLLAGSRFGMVAAVELGQRSGQAGGHKGAAPYGRRTELGIMTVRGRGRW